MSALPCPACNGEGFRSFPSDICQTQVDVWPADVLVTCDCCDGKGVVSADDFSVDDSGSTEHHVDPVLCDEYEIVAELIALISAPWPCVPGYAL